MQNDSAPVPTPPNPPCVVRSANPAYPPSRTAHLRPFRPGQSGNPSGLTKDGRPTKSAAIERELKAALSKPNRTERLVSRWLKHAEKGSAPHLQMILERLYPKEEKSGGAQVVVQGVRLELTPGSTTVEVVQRTLDQQGMVASAEPQVEDDPSLPG